LVPPTGLRLNICHPSGRHIHLLTNAFEQSCKTFQQKLIDTCIYFVESNFYFVQKHLLKGVSARLGREPVQTYIDYTFDAVLGGAKPRYSVFSSSHGIHS